MSFLYFVPDGKELKGLSYAFEGGLSGAKKRGCHGFKPTSEFHSSGQVYSDDCVEPGQRGFYPDRQTWQKHPRVEGIWIGWYTDSPPGPDSLARKKQLRGHPIKLCDGNTWKIPIVQTWEMFDDEQLVMTPALERRFTLGADGNWCYGDGFPEHQALLECSMKWWGLSEAQVVLDAGHELSDEIKEEMQRRSTITKPDLCELACIPLEYNYRVSVAEIGLLQLLSEERAAELLNLMLDTPKLLAQQAEEAKKNGTAPNSGTPLQTKSSGVPVAKGSLESDLPSCTGASTAVRTA